MKFYFDFSGYGLLIALLLTMRSDTNGYGIKIQTTHNPLKCQEAGTLGISSHQHTWQISSPNASHTVVLLLGMAFSGTSALHFLLQHNNSNVGTLFSDPDQQETLKGTNEGWTLNFSDDTEDQKVSGQHLKQYDDRWNPKIFREQVGKPWRDLAHLYINNWPAGPQYLIEKSPPELLYYKQILKGLKNLKLEDANKLKGQPRVALILLTRHPCNYKSPSYSLWTLYFHRLLLNKAVHDGDIFLLRYEDLCDPSNDRHRLREELANFLPGFGSLDFDAIPWSSLDRRQRRHRRALTHEHEAISLNTYCASTFVPSLPLHDFIALHPPATKREASFAPEFKNSTLRNLKDALDYMGYK